MNEKNKIQIHLSLLTNLHHDLEAHLDPDGDTDIVLEDHEGGVVLLLGPEIYELQSCQELGQLADLASDWLCTLVQPIRSQLAC